MESSSSKYEVSLVPENAASFYAHTREKLSQLNSNIDRVDLKDADVLEKVDPNKRKRVELEQINMFLIEKFWNESGSINLDIEHSYSDYLKSEQKNNPLKISNHLIVYLRDVFRNNLSKWLKSDKTKEKYKKELDRHAEIIKDPASGRMHALSENEINAGLMTFVSFFSNICEFIPVKYYKQNGKGITEQEWERILINSVPLFLLFAKNSMDVHSALNMCVWELDNWKIIKNGDSQTMDLVDDFWPKLADKLEIHKRAIRDSKFLTEPEKIVNSVATDCPALHAITSDNINVISAMYKDSMRVVKKYIFPNLPKINNAILEQSKI